MQELYVNNAHLDNHHVQHQVLLLHVHLDISYQQQMYVLYVLQVQLLHVMLLVLHLDFIPVEAPVLLVLHLQLLHVILHV